MPTSLTIAALMVWSLLQLKTKLQAAEEELQRKQLELESAQAEVSYRAGTDKHCLLCYVIFVNRKGFCGSVYIMMNCRVPDCPKRMKLW